MCLKHYSNLTLKTSYKCVMDLTERSFSCEIYWTNSCFYAQLNSVSTPHPFGYSHLSDENKHLCDESIHPSIHISILYPFSSTYPIQGRQGLEPLPAVTGWKAEYISLFFFCCWVTEYLYCQLSFAVMELLFFKELQCK